MTKPIEEIVAEAIYRSPLHGMPFEDCCILAKEVCRELDRQCELVDATDINKCPGCGGVADNGFSRHLPPEPYYCTKCELK